MSPRKIFLLALGTIASAWLSARVLNLEPRWGEPLRDVPIGLGVATALAAVNYVLLTRAPSNWLVNGVRAVYCEILVPLFGRLGRAGVIWLGAAAGLGEEWLFRGVLQPMIGLIAASLLFGLAHVGGRRMLAFGVWASGMGLAMGTLALATGGITAPIVAHGVYDMLALQYIRHGARNE